MSCVLFACLSRTALRQEKHLLCHHQSPPTLLPNRLSFHAWLLPLARRDKGPGAAHETLPQPDFHLETFKRQRWGRHHSDKEVSWFASQCKPHRVPGATIRREPPPDKQQEVRCAHLCGHQGCRSYWGLPLRGGAWPILYRKSIFSPWKLLLQLGFDPQIKSLESNLVARVDLDIQVSFAWISAEV